MLSIYQTKRMILIPMSFLYKNELNKLHTDPDVMQFIVGGPYNSEKSHMIASANLYIWNHRGKLYLSKELL